MRARSISFARLLSLVLLLVLSGCGIFGGSGSKAKKEEKTDPYPLVSFSEEVTLTRVWQLDVGQGLEKKYGSLSPAIDGRRVFAASLDGKVVAAEADSGDLIWRIDLADLASAEGGRRRARQSGDLISGGVGAAAGLVFVGTSDGKLLALNQSDGSLAWRADTGSEVLAPPQANSSLVVTQSINGRVAAFDLLTGTSKWLYDSQVPALSVRGTSSPLVLEDLVICGFANGRVLLMDAVQGVPRWERRVGIPRGQSELDRLVDVDGRMILLQNRLFVVSYQGQMLSIDILEGQIVWAREASSFVGLGAGFGNIYAVLDDDRLIAVDEANSREIWSTESLRYRRLTTPATIGNHVAVGDLEGYVHLLAQSDGRFTGRAKVDGAGIVGQLVAVGDRLYVQGKSGKLTALQVR